MWTWRKKFWLQRLLNSFYGENLQNSNLYFKVFSRLSFLITAAIHWFQELSIIPYIFKLQSTVH